MKLEITNKVRVGLNDGDSLPLERCVCGQVAGPWEWILDSDPEYKSECDTCGRKMWFSIEIKVWQELREEDRLHNQPLVPYKAPKELNAVLFGGFPEGIHDDD